MPKEYNNYEPIPLKFLKSDGTITDALVIDAGGGGTQDVLVKNTSDQPIYVVFSNPPVVQVNNFPTTQQISGNVSLLNISTNAGNTDDLPTNQIGLVGTNRMFAFDGTDWHRVYCDANGNLKVVMANNAFHHITATGSVVSGASTLERIVIGKAGAAADTLTVYDGTSNSGSVISVISLATPTEFAFHASVATGIFVEFSAAGADVTIMTQ